MPWASVYIALGSNLNDPATQIQQGLSALAALPEVNDVRCAPWYRSRAIGPGNQPDYINTVASATTTLTPETLLRALQQIEDKQGRQRTIRWGARTLDLDLLLYNQLQYQTDSLQLPHPQLRHRGFVLLPLADLAPDLVLPNGYSITDYLAQCDTQDLQRIDTATATGY